jgi:hypothetical protein
LILTNVTNDMAAGAKILYLRGTNTEGNMLTSQLDDNGGALSVQVDGSAVWILTNEFNSYSGSTTSGAGSLGIGHDNALGASTLVLTNGTLFAYGADRVIANTVEVRYLRSVSIRNHEIFRRQQRGTQHVRTFHRPRLAK